MIWVDILDEILIFQVWFDHLDNKKNTSTMLFYDRELWNLQSEIMVFILQLVQIYMLQHTDFHSLCLQTRAKENLSNQKNLNVFLLMLIRIYKYIHVNHSCHQLFDILLPNTINLYDVVNSLAVLLYNHYIMISLYQILYLWLVYWFVDLENLL